MFSDLWRVFFDLILYNIGAMKNKTGLFIVGVIIVVIIVVVLIMQSQVPNQVQQEVVDNNAAIPQSDNNNEVVVPPKAGEDYVSSDISSHKTDADCWIAVNGNVYDITWWIKRNPSESGSIVNFCGKDGSAAIKSGAPLQQETLDSYWIGTLLQ